MAVASAARTIRAIVPARLYRVIRPTLIDIYYRIRRLLGRDGVVALDGVLLDLRGAELSPIMRHQMLSGTYEKPESVLVRRFLDASDVVLELGAGAGFIGTLCAKVVGDGRVHSFEANPALEPLIRRNHALNDVRPALTIALLARGSGTETFFVTRHFWASSRIARRGARAIAVERRDLNEAVREVAPSFMIMDIEGGEIDVADYLEPGAIRKLVMELHPEVVPAARIEAMFETLARKGFTVAYRSADGRHAYLTRSSD